MSWPTVSSLGPRPSSSGMSVVSASSAGSAGGFPSQIKRRLLIRWLLVVEVRLVLRGETILATARNALMHRNHLDAKGRCETTVR